MCKQGLCVCIGGGALSSVRIRPLAAMLFSLLAAALCLHLLLKHHPALTPPLRCPPRDALRQVVEVQPMLDTCGARYHLLKVPLCCRLTMLCCAASCCAGPVHAGYVRRQVPLTQGAAEVAVATFTGTCGTVCLNWIQANGVPVAY